jgi:hypothetical protein
MIEYEDVSGTAVAAAESESREQESEEQEPEAEAERREPESEPEPEAGLIEPAATPDEEAVDEPVEPEVTPDEAPQDVAATDVAEPEPVPEWQPEPPPEPQFEPEPEAESQPEAEPRAATGVADLTERMLGIQLAFIDDPRQAAMDADDLLAEVLQVFADDMARRRRELDSGSVDVGAGPDTEHLRLAVRRSRELVELLSRAI